MHYFIFSVCCVFFLSGLFVGAKGIYIEYNAYKGISVSFSSKVQQQHFDFGKLKDVLSKSSELLYHATRKRSYFDEFVISVPSSWTSDICQEYATEVPRMVDVYITDSSQHTTLKAQHSRGCENRGDVMYLPLSWLRGNTEDLARQFVQQWAIYRYGVFEENPEENGLCFISYKNSWSPVGCFNVKTEIEPAYYENGLPLCYFPEDFFDNEELMSSLMFTQNLSKAMDFCDGSKKFPHNPAMPTPHNNLCQGKTVWSVIENSEDFKHAKNLPREDDNPPKATSFKCVRQPPIQLTFAIQNSSSEDLTQAVDELKYSLLHFLPHMAPKDSKVNLMTFSDSFFTESSNPVELDLSDEAILTKTLDDYVYTFKVLTSTCLSCGLQKALNISATNQHPNPIALVVAWESALIGQKTKDLVKIIEDYPTVLLHLVLVEDTEADIVPAALVNAIRSTRGLIFNLPKENVLMATKLNAILADVFENPLILEDKIIVAHESSYTDITGDIVDTFVTPRGLTGKLVYIMHCNINGPIRQVSTNCTLWDEFSSTYKCGEVIELSDAKAAQKTWRHTFGYRIGPAPPVCSSVAVLSLAAMNPNSLTLRGWLSAYTIKPAENPLIIYAEILYSLEANFQVEAIVSGPGLQTPFRIELRDSGNGDPDVKKGDGIYSRYFTSFSQTGTYVVTIFVEVIGSEDYSTQERATSEVRVTQTKVIGSFNVAETPPRIDIIPPSRVGDLRVVSVDHENSTVTLQWTAPGNDYDFGAATKYEIKYSTNWANLMELYFNSEENSLSEPVHMYSPQKSGDTENLAFYFPKFHEDMTYYVALRAIDRNSNQGRISNICQVLVKRGKLVSTEITTNTEVTKFSSISSVFTETDNITESITSITEITTDVSGYPNHTITSDGTSTVIIPFQHNSEDYFSKKMVILFSSSVGGGVLLIIIIINVTVCCCYMKRKKSPKEPKRLSRKASLRPPYNLNIAYKQGSQSSLQTENDVGISQSTLVDQRIYTEPHSSSPKERNKYSYHTSRSLSDAANSLTADTELGFKLVQAMPAYATSSLSRYANKLNDHDTEEETEMKHRQAQPQKPQMYPLGVV